MANATARGSYAWQSVCGPQKRGLGWDCVAPNTVVAILLVWLLAAVVAHVLKRQWKDWFMNQTSRHQRNIVSYIVGLIVKLLGLLVTVAASAGAMVYNEDMSEDEQRLALVFGFLLVSILYVWEMVYRIEIHPFLLIHHLATLFLVIIASTAMYEMETRMHDTQSSWQSSSEPQELYQLADLQAAMHHGRKTVLRIMYIELVFAMSNQPVLVALLAHRAKSVWTQRWFQGATCWELVTKLLRAGLVFALYGTMGYEEMLNRNCSEIRWCTELRILYPVLAAAILVANMHMVFTLWQLSTRDTRTDGSDAAVLVADSAKLEIDPDFIEDAQLKIQTGDASAKAQCIV